MEIHRIDSFVRYWTRIRGRTMTVVRCIPADRLEWAHRPGMFTLGDLARHLGAAQRYMFAETACGRPWCYPGHGPDLAADLDETVGFLEQMNAETVELLRALPDARLHEDCTTPVGARLKVWKWLRAMVEHEIHHRGQIYLNLSMLGVPTPPLFTLTAEEIIEQSVPRS